MDKNKVDLVRLPYFEVLLDGVDVEYMLLSTYRIKFGYPHHTTETEPLTVPHITKAYETILRGERYEPPLPDKLRMSRGIARVTADDQARSARRNTLARAIR
jgi:hypothetical protein